MTWQHLSMFFSVTIGMSSTIEALTRGELLFKYLNNTFSCSLLVFSFLGWKGLNIIFAVNAALCISYHFQSTNVSQYCSDKIFNHTHDKISHWCKNIFDCLSACESTSNQCIYYDVLINTEQYCVLPNHSTRQHELLESSEKYLLYIWKKVQIINALANIVFVKVKIIKNHAAIITSLITLVVELTATNKRLVSQLAEAFGQ